IEQMNVLRPRGDRQRRTFAWNIAIADARADEGAAAIEIEDRGVAQIFDQLHGCRNSPVSDPDCAGADAHDDVALATFLQSRLEAMARDLDKAVAVAGGDQIHRRAADKSRDID